ncbi:MAG: DUF4012 domain-containing protein [Acidimicrobiia bacterium]
MPPAASSTAARREPPVRTRRRRLRWTVLAVVVVLLAWTAFAGARMVEARNHAQRGLDELKAAQRQLDPAQLIRGKDLPQLRLAETEFQQASDAAGSGFLTPFEILPVIGRQVRSVRALTSGASTVVRVGVRTMDESRRQLDATARNGQQRVALVDRLGTIGGRASRDLAGVGLGPGNALLGPLASARDKFATQLHKAQTAMRDVKDASAGIGQMAKGPSKYLLLAANNGEMRAGSGMLLSAGVLSVENGSFSLGPMISVTDLKLPPGAVPVTGDYAHLWGWLDPTQEWRYLAMSPQFDTTAALAAQMWKAKTGESVDGVVALDPLALRALVKVSGPVTVEGKTIDKDNIVKQILLQQYIDYANDNPLDDTPANQARRERNGVIARAIVERLDQVDWHIADLVDDLRSAARGRHVLFWSSKPEQQRGWRAAGVSGILPTDGVMVSLENRAGNKLDQFVAIRTDIDHRSMRTGSEVTMRITVVNLAPEGLPEYVQGPYPRSGFMPGEYRGILAVSIPKVARDIGLDGVSKVVAAGPDGSTRVVAGDMALLRGQTGTYTVRFTVPKGYEHLQVVPSGRSPVVTYRAGSHQWEDDGPHDLSW